MPNTLAYLAIGLSPLLILSFFLMFDRTKALLLSVLVTYLFLPSRTEIDLPGFPALDKVTLPGVTLLLVLIVGFGHASRRQKANMRQVPPIGPIIWALIAIYICTPLATSLVNPEPLFYGPTTLPGLVPYDAFGPIFMNLSNIGIFLLARRHLATIDQQKQLLRMLVWFGVFYAVLVAIELRLSPQLHIWVYGFFPHSFAQMVRGDGFRPVVFLDHALSTTFFLVVALAASAILLKQTKGGSQRPLFLLITVFVFVVLAWSKTVSSLAYGIFVVAAVLFLPKRLQLWGAMVLCVLVLAFPLLRAAQVFPADRIIAAIETIAPDRAQSLETRFSNEDALIDKSMDRPLFGHGEFDRNFVFDERFGNKTTIVDGTWIVTVSAYGAVGFVSLFLLLSAPIFQMAIRSKTIDADNTISIGLALMLSVNLFNLLPNATLTPITWMIAGALLGYAQQHAAAEKRQSKDVYRGKSLGHVPHTARSRT